MVVTICHEIETQQRHFITLLDSGSQNELDFEVLADSALKIAHGFDSLSQQVIPHLELGYNDTNFGLASDGTNGKMGYTVSFTDGIMEMVRRLAYTSSELKAAFLKRLGLLEHGANQSLDENAFALRNKVMCSGTSNEFDAKSKVTNRIAFDLGGTLMKIAYCFESKHCEMLDNLYWAHHAIYNVLRVLERHHGSDLLLRCEISANINLMLPEMIRLGGSTVVRLHRAPVDSIRDILKSLLATKVITDETIVHATGGGALKYAEVFQELLPKNRFHKIDEMPSVVEGTDIVHSISSCFIKYNMKGGFTELVSLEPTYPYLIVNIGSGISFIKVTSKGKFERVTGTSVGGGTMHGIASLFLGSKSFEDVVALYENGTNCMDTFLPETNTNAPITYGLRSRPEDSVRSTSDMISYSIGQIAFLVAKQHGVKRVIFTGSYSANHLMTMDVIASAVAHTASSYEEDPMDILTPIFGGYSGVIGCLFME
ncbi:pantothenate kinase 1 [Babesia ovis]|uniref:Pantothenate kinase 1 n=1 Tax=Babesia ovis TaxID=5869 RepID=A0A9W5WVM1_BABOV|nr:pantothenate kinase 1 [Babesia ovis]